MFCSPLKHIIPQNNMLLCVRGIDRFNSPLSPRKTGLIIVLSNDAVFHLAKSKIMDFTHANSY